MPGPDGLNGERTDCAARELAGWAGMAIDGFLTRSVRDTAAMLDACEGADPGAPYWAPPLGRGHMAAISRPAA